MPKLRHSSLAASLLALTACADAERIEPPAPAAPVEHTATFVGYTYDGVTGERLTGSTVELLVAETTVAGTVAADGRYVAGPISAWDDFTVLIGGNGDAYRPFMSHNARVGLPPELSQSDDIADIGTHQTFFFDAYLFPLGLTAPTVNITVVTGIPGEQPNGEYRLLPIGPSVLVSDPAETPPGVPGQIWVNDEDLQGGVLSGSIVNGTFTLAGDQLVYGVTYQVDIFGVAGYQPLSSTFSSGLETDKTFTLVEEQGEPLAVVSSNAATCIPPTSPNASSGATVTITFNQVVEFADTGYPGGSQEALDDGISINSPNANMDGLQNTLFADLSDTSQERGVSASINGAQLTIDFNPSAGLEVLDAGDPIIGVTYSGLTNVALRRINAPSSTMTLAALLGVSSITCD